MNKKEIKEKVAINLCGGLNEAYEELRNLEPPDLEGLKIIAMVYRKCNMPERANKILYEVSSLASHRKSVLNSGIIVNTETTGYGGTNETRITISSDRPGRAVSCDHVSA